MKIKFAIIKKTLLALLLSVLFTYCNSSERSDLIYLYSKDKSQVISIISDYNNNKRIIALGKTITQPNSNYVQLDISDVTEFSDEIGICWLSNNGWQIVNNNSKIIKTDLDTTKYIIKTKWEEDEDGIPTPIFYKKENCYTVGALNYSKIHPSDNGYVERQ